MGAESILLIGPMSRTIELPPQGVSEKDFWPFIVHSQTLSLDSIAGAAICCICGTTVGGTATACAVCAACKNGADACAGTTDGVGALAGAAPTVVWLCVRIEPTASPMATVAIDSPPKIHGNRSLCLSIARIIPRFGRRRSASQATPQPGRRRGPRHCGRLVASMTKMTP